MITGPHTYYAVMGGTLFEFHSQAECNSFVAEMDGEALKVDTIFDCQDRIHTIGEVGWRVRMVSLIDPVEG